MAADIVKLLLTLGESISKGVQALMKGKRERRDRIAKLFEDIAHCLGGIASSIRSGQVPFSQCHELATYLGELRQAIGANVEPDKVAMLLSYLEEAHAAPIGFIEYRIQHELMLRSGSNKGLERRADTVDRIAGIFRANANILRAKA